MSQLIQLKNRINAISTIKKITNAMRIISMSLHSKLNRQVEHIKEYDKELSSIFSIVSSCINKNSNEEESKNNNELVIIAGSDKGLCGGFNSLIIQSFNENYKAKENIEIITVGKKIKDLLKNGYKLVDQIENLSYQRITEISNSIVEKINKNNYKKVTVIYTESKSFFLQKSKLKQIIPLKIEHHHNKSIDSSDYVWEEDPHTLYEALKKEYIIFSIKKCLFESLFSEQASRFRSMDNANRSADNLLEDMKMQYSKLRQTKITRELTELSSHF